MGEKYGYTLVDVINKQDAIFVRKNIISKEKTPALLKWKSVAKKRTKLPCMSECNVRFIPLSRIFKLWKS